MNENWCIVVFFYLVCVWALVVLLSPDILIVAVNVLNLVVLGIFGDEILQSFSHLVLQSVCLTVCDLQKDQEEETNWEQMCAITNVL